MLSDEDFLQVIANAPLVSIDLLVRRGDGSLLLGLRRNKPAQGTWFVPGGRIRKGESVEEAFARITETELGQRVSFADAMFRGVFTHKYPDNFLEAPEVQTHYVVLAYELDKAIDLASIPTSQHSICRWWTVAQAEVCELVHHNTLAYFSVDAFSARPSPTTAWVAQYEALNNRRNSLNQLVWQTPVVSLTAQAFLFAIVFSRDVSTNNQLVAAGLGCITAFASAQLLAKHRAGELQLGLAAEAFERRAQIPVINANKALAWNPWYVRQPSFRLWILVLLAFGMTSLAVAIANLLSRL
jgi:colanic acid biosynthesis protein WcaH